MRRTMVLAAVLAVLTVSASYQDDSKGTPALSVAASPHALFIELFTNEGIGTMTGQDQEGGRQRNPRETLSVYDDTLNAACPPMTAPQNKTMKGAGFPAGRSETVRGDSGPPAGAHGCALPPNAGKL